MLQCELWLNELALTGGEDGFNKTINQFGAH